MSDHHVRVHFVWTGSRFPYHARLAIESAIVAMPEARIDLDIVGDAPTSDHFRTVAGYDRVSVTRWTPGELFEHCPLGPASYQALLGRLPARSPAAISNLARLAVLYTHGGVYLDTDVLVLRGLHRPSVHGSYVGVERVWDRNRSRIERGLGPVAAIKAAPWAARWAACRVDSAVWHGRLRLANRLPDAGHMREQVNNAVIGAPRESPFIAYALARALEVDPSIRFALGPNLLDDVVRAEPRLGCDEHSAGAHTRRHARTSLFAAGRAGVRGRLDRNLATFVRLRVRDAATLVRSGRHPVPPVHAHLNLTGSARNTSAVLSVREQIDDTIRRAGHDAWAGEINTRRGRRAGALARSGFDVVGREPNHTLGWLTGEPVDRLTVVRRVR